MTTAEPSSLARGAQSLRRFIRANPLLWLAGERYGAELDRAEAAPETMSLADRFSVGRLLEEAATWDDDEGLRTLGAAIIDEVLAIGATHAAEASILLQDVAEPKRSVRYLRLVKSRLDVTPAPAPAPVDNTVADGMRESVRTYLETIYPPAVAPEK